MDARWWSPSVEERGGDGQGHGHEREGGRVQGACWCGRGERADTEGRVDANVNDTEVADELIMGDEGVVYLTGPTTPVRGERD